MMASIDKNQLKQAFSGAARHYDDFAALQSQVGLSLLSKFPIQTQAGMILDLGCGTGFLGRHMAIKPKVQSLLGLDIAFTMLQICREKQVNSPQYYVCADAENLPLLTSSVQQIYANLALQWCHNLATVFKGCQQVLKPDGQLVFSSFGPASLQELKQAWAEVDDFTHVNSFYSLPEIEKFLEYADFSRIESESVIYQSRYPSVMALMQELKGIGAHNVNIKRNKQMTTRKQVQQMITCYAQNMAGGPVLASYEIIYVRAFL
jgi:malonyl-CoA O-methyltransferase